MTNEKSAGIAEIKETLPRFVSEKRMGHILSVEKECVSMAKLYDLSENEGYILQKAALLHDITHEMSFEEQLALLELYGIPQETADTKCRSVLHQFTGAALAADLFGLENEGVLAISCHTTGKENMTIPEMILCLADYIEETREYSYCKELREEFYSHCTKENRDRLLAECMLRYLENTIDHLTEKGAYIHPLTLKAIKSYKKQIGNYNVLK